MKIYRITFRDDVEGCLGFEFYATRTEAVTAKKENERGGSTAIIEALNIGKTRADFVALLNRIAQHPDNG